MLQGKQMRPTQTCVKPSEWYKSHASLIVRPTACQADSRWFEPGLVPKNFQNLHAIFNLKNTTSFAVVENIVRKPATNLLNNLLICGPNPHLPAGEHSPIPRIYV